MNLGFFVNQAFPINSSNGGAEYLEVPQGTGFVLTPPKNAAGAVIQVPKGSFSYRLDSSPVSVVQVANFNAGTGSFIYLTSKAAITNFKGVTAPAGGAVNINVQYFSQQPQV